MVVDSMKFPDGAETLVILGEPFKFREKGALKVDFEGKIIEFDPGDRNHLRRLERILRRRLLQELEPAVEEYCGRLGVRFNRMTVKKMRARWGSCSSNGNLNFNLWLVCLPRELIRYVAWHEVAHMKERGHRRSFWGLMAREFGNYKEMEKHLAGCWSLVQGAAFLLARGKAWPPASRSRPMPRAQRSSPGSPRPSS
jgi:predicted metal-dependent hydrolase